jgi:hypothetical protein
MRARSTQDLAPIAHRSTCRDMITTEADGDSGVPHRRSMLFPLRGGVAAREQLSSTEQENES